MIYKCYCLFPFHFSYWILYILFVYNHCMNFIKIFHLSKAWTMTALTSSPFPLSHLLPLPSCLFPYCSKIQRYVMLVCVRRSTCERTHMIFITLSQLYSLFHIKLLKMELFAYIHNLNIFPSWLFPQVRADQVILRNEILGGDKIVKERRHTWTAWREITWMTITQPTYPPCDFPMGAMLSWVISIKKQIR